VLWINAKCKLGVISQEWLKIEVKLLLSAKYEVIYAASIGTTTDDFEWPFRASCAVCLIAEIIVVMGMLLSCFVMTSMVILTYMTHPANPNLL